MEVNTNHLIIFDACSLINLINIDYEHQEIIKYLNKYFNFYLPEKVQNEIRSNVKNKVSSINVRTREDKEYKKNFNEYIDILTGELWRNVSQDQQIKKDLGKDIYNVLAQIIGNKKEEGEWYCVAHAFYLSRLHQSRLSVYTDDYPAIKEYRNVFTNQKIGQVEDSSDFLVLLYWNCPEISQVKLKRYLRDLSSEYKSEINQLLEKIRNFRDQKLNIKETNLRIEVSEFEQMLANVNLTDLAEKREEILRASGRFKKPLKELFSKFKNVFDLSGDNNLLSKIEKIIAYIDKNEIFKPF